MKAITKTEKTKKKSKANLIRDVKAQLYQGLAEIEAMLPPGAQSQIEVNEDQRDPKKAKYVVDIRLSSSLGNFRVKATNADVFEAVAQAKTKMRTDIEDVYRASMSTSERMAVVDHLLRGPYLH